MPAHGQLGGQILPAEPDDLLGAQAGEAVQRDQGAVARSLADRSRAGSVDQTAKIGGIECRPSATAPSGRPGHERPGRVPARRPPHRKLRVQRRQVCRRISAEHRPDGPDESLDREQTDTSGRARDRRRRLAQQPGKQIEIGEERPQGDRLIDGTSLAQQRSKLARLTPHRARVSALRTLASWNVASRRSESSSGREAGGRRSWSQHPS